MGGRVRQRRDGGGWPVAALLSVLAHAGVAASVPHIMIEGGAGAAEPDPRGGSLVLVDLSPPPPPPPPPPQPRLAVVPEPPIPEEPELGIEASPSETGAALGFAEATEHMADQSEVVQPALDPLAGSPGAAAPMPAPPSPSAPVVNPAAEPMPPASPGREAVEERASEEPPREEAAETASGSEVEHREDARREEREEPRPAPLAMEDLEREAAETARAAAAVVSDMVSRLERLVEETGAAGAAEGETREHEPRAGEARAAPAGEEDRLEAGPPPEPEPASRGADGSTAEASPEEAARTIEPSPLPAPMPAQPTSRPAEKPGARPGEVSEKESDPTALEKPLVVRPGRPLAAEGLEIVTRRPVFSKVTRSLAAPRNPTLRVVFDRTGRVSRAEIVESSGVKDVDEPVLFAVYKWSARGKRLAELPAGDPRAGVVLTVTILLR